MLLIRWYVPDDITDLHLLWIRSRRPPLISSTSWRPTHSDWLLRNSAAQEKSLIPSFFLSFLLPYFPHSLPHFLIRYFLCLSVNQAIGLHQLLPVNIQHVLVLSSTVALTVKTQQHFRKHKNISENATAFQKTRKHFRKRDSISENTKTFQKTRRHF